MFKMYLSVYMYIISIYVNYDNNYSSEFLEKIVNFMNPINHYMSVPLLNPQFLTPIFCHNC